MNSPSSGSVYEITGGLRVCAPGNPRLMTPYILTEQRDWFEDEIKFVRNLIQTGDVIVDVGANYGVYTLVAAQHAGPDGKVIAFEPSAATAGWLRESIATNRFSHITLIEKAVSNQPGTGRLSAEANSELNRLETPSAPTGGESVALTTLDATRRDLALTQVDFVKIDAEGHEVKVIEGGQDFFSALSPLVMIEIKAGTQVDMAPVGRLENFGYAPYRLTPGLNALAPFDGSKPIDGYQLNLFCCKPDRAAQLAARGLLVLPPLDGDVGDADQWRTCFARLAFAKSFMTAWLDTTATRPEPGWEKYRHILNLYARSRDAGQPIAVRYASLVTSYLQLEGLIKVGGSMPRLLTFARIAADSGERAVAVGVLKHVIDHIRSSNGIFIGEPFVPPAPAFEQIDPGENKVNWAVAAALDAYESKRAFSSYFAPQETVGIVTDLRRLGYCSEAMERRYQLASTRS